MVRRLDSIIDLDFRHADSAEKPMLICFTTPKLKFGGEATRLDWPLPVVWRLGAVH